MAHLSQSGLTFGYRQGGNEGGDTALLLIPENALVPVYGANPNLTDWTRYSEADGYYIGATQTNADIGTTIAGVAGGLYSVGMSSTSYGRYHHDPISGGVYINFNDPYPSGQGPGITNSTGGNLTNASYPYNSNNQTWIRYGFTGGASTYPTMYSSAGDHTHTLTTGVTLTIEVTATNQDRIDISPTPITYIKINTVAVTYSYTRGHTLAVINPSTRTLDSITTYDTYGAGNSTALLNALNTVDYGKLVVITSYDGISLDSATRDLLNSSTFRQVGDSLISDTWTSQRVSHLFIGFKKDTILAAVPGFTPVEAAVVGASEASPTRTFTDAGTFVSASSFRPQTIEVTLLRANKSTDVLPINSLVFSQLMPNDYADVVTTGGAAAYLKGVSSGGTTLSAITSLSSALTVSTSGIHHHYYAYPVPANYGTREYPKYSLGPNGEPAHTIAANATDTPNSGAHTHPTSIQFSQPNLNSTLLKLWKNISAEAPTTDIILMYVGDLTNFSVPNWHICDGTNGTVNIPSAFVGYNSTDGTWGTSTSDLTGLNYTTALSQSDWNHTHFRTVYGNFWETGDLQNHNTTLFYHTHPLTGIAARYKPPMIKVAFIQYKGYPSFTPIPPLNTQIPIITGTPYYNNTLTCSTGVWTSTTDLTYKYQWQYGSGASFTNIVGATANTYGPLAYLQYIGQTLRCMVTATNRIGSVLSISAPTAAITGPVTGEFVASASSGTWVCPTGVTSISVLCVGAGGGGYNNGGGGGGGALAYGNSITVVPGQSYSYVAGAGSAGNNGGSSSFNTSWVVAGGGIVGASGIARQCGGGGGAGGYGGTGGIGSYCGGTGPFYAGGAGGNYSGTYCTGGGSGGSGGRGSGQSGGAIGYRDVNANGNQGGGGGGGTGYFFESGAQGGGGVGIFGKGTAGIGTLGTVSIGASGYAQMNGGSGGGNGGSYGAGGLYGGGACGIRPSSGVLSNIGGAGAVRIIWPGNLRQFPSTNVTAL
jgi:hypothetical protein